MSLFLISVLVSFALVHLSIGAAVATAAGSATVNETALDAVFSKLTSIYESSPNITEGLFNATETLWWENGVIWETYMDYAKYTDSDDYEEMVGESIVDQSYGTAHDFFGTNYTYNSIVLSRWNDDVEWWAQAALIGAELYGADSYMPGLTGNGTWITLVQQTINEVYDMWWSDDCGGGIFWSTNPTDSQTYKSSITNIEFISLGARTYLLTGNATLLAITEQLFDWVISSGTVDLETGIVNDGVDTGECNVETGQYSYSYGQFLGGLSWLYQATGNTTYLDYATNVAATAISVFAPTGVAQEPCEVDNTCDNDQQGFKAIFLRNLVYLYNTATDVTLKSSLSNVIETSAAAALATCDSQWNCSGEWTNTSTQVYPAFRSTHLVGAALVALEGISVG